MRSLIAALILTAFLAAPCGAATEAGDMGGMDHSQHGMTDQPMTATDQQPTAGTDQQPMEGMDHSQHDMAGQATDGTMGGAMDGAMDEDEAAGHDHQQMMEEAAQENLPVGIEEHLGAMLPDVVFSDSEGNQVRLLDLMDTPVLLLPIYYRCPDVCSLLQGSVASVLPQVKLTPGTELKVVSLSFDARETPKDAARAKKNYTAISGDAFPPQYWTFLTGDQQAIDATLQAIGYTVQKQGGLWAHPVAALAIAPGGKVVRYLYGTTFLPFDITMAGSEAAQGKTGLSVKRLLSFCYNYDPDGRRYVFDILRVSGYSIVGFVALFLAWLIWGGKKKRR